MTGPAHWHEASRDAGHDDMQLAAITYYREHAPRSMTFGKNSALLRYHYVHPEWSLRSRNGSIQAFADIAIEYRHPTEPTTANNGYILVELKPYIMSCGGLLRQCRTIENAAFESGTYHKLIRAMVYDDDPKLPELERLFASTAFYVDRMPRSALEHVA